MARHTLLENAGTAVVVCSAVFIGLKMAIMSRYGLTDKFNLFFFSLKSPGKPQISGFANVAMRHYIRSSNIINKIFYVLIASFALLYVILNAALQR